LNVKSCADEKIRKITAKRKKTKARYVVARRLYIAASDTALAR
jgi:hypothetical protein